MKWSSDVVTSIVCLDRIVGIPNAELDELLHLLERSCCKLGGYLNLRLTCRVKMLYRKSIKALEIMKGF